MLKAVLASIAAALLAGCAGLAPTVPASSPADPGAGYIAGLFNREGMSFALRIRSLDGKGDYVLPMGEDTRWPASLRRSSVAIRVPPGRYAVSEAFTYATVSKQTISRAPDTVNLDRRQFEVRAGAVAHLGEVSVETRRFRVAGSNDVWYELCVLPQATPEHEVATAFRAAYPGLAAQPLRCVSCPPPA